MFENPVPQALGKGPRNAFVASAEDGDPASPLLQFPGQHLGHRRFAGAADREVADTDDQAAYFLGAKHARAVESQTGLNGALVSQSEQPENKFEGIGPTAFSALENNIDRIAFEALEDDSHQSTGWVPLLSGDRIMVRAVGSTACIAPATRSGDSRARQQTADPDPLR